MWPVLTAGAAAGSVDFGSEDEGTSGSWVVAQAPVITRVARTIEVSVVWIRIGGSWVPAGTTLEPRRNRHRDALFRRLRFDHEQPHARGGRCLARPGGARV